MTVTVFVLLCPLDDAVTLFLEAWRTEIQPHFRAEEEVLLPEFARIVPPDDPLIVRTLTEHVALRRAVRQFRPRSHCRHRRMRLAVQPAKPQRLTEAA